MDVGVIEGGTPTSTARSRRPVSILVAGSTPRQANKLRAQLELTQATSRGPKASLARSRGCREPVASEDEGQPNFV